MRHQAEADLGAASFDRAALIHEIQGRAATIALFSKELVCSARRNDPRWLDTRLNRICEAAQEMQRIIDAIRRLDHAAPLERSVVDVSAICADVVRRQVELRPDFARAGVEIEPGIRATGDAAQIEIVLENLIGNALKFSSGRPSPRVRIAAVREGGCVVIHVNDNGAGIRPADATRMFHPFVRCHPEFEGSGLGLALSRRIVERHGGMIWANGSAGAGTTVSFRIAEG